MTVRQRIINKAIELLQGRPQGLRFSELARLLRDELQDIKPNNIPATLVNLENLANGVIVKPAKGIFKHYSFDTPFSIETPGIEPFQITATREEDFYEPFALWLVEELEECSKAIKLGGSRFRDKWGTPDVIGVLIPKPSDIIKFPAEIVSAEIKIDTNGLITAFGQACAYKLFSHKSYIVVPQAASEDDISRLDSLCLIFGIGLIVFNHLNPSEPNFTIKTRAAIHQPDMFYVNKHIRLIADELL